ncbi:MAG: 3-hydroxyisobutyrate dehydrogenase [Rhizobiales bacterium PAR1]|nr:MAG: 3-hydroxyisobutyrate dehydrogenase [Rhizobiales bacterium PAR1]
MSKQRIGFIGVGFMGHGMALNLMAKGFPLTIMGNRNRAPVEDLVGRGAKEVKSPREVAENSDILFICVTDSPTVEKIIRDPDGVKAGAHPGLIVVDCSTANPVSTEALAKELDDVGVAMADAPLGGTPAQAAVGQLSAMVGADPQVYARIEPAISAWAAKVVHLGPIGSGHKMKLLNNFLSMGYAAIYAEALALGQKVGISIETFDSVIRGSRMDCGFYQTFMGYALEGNPEAHKFTLSNAAKDLRYVDAMASAAQLANPISSAAKNLFAQAVGAGKGSHFVPTIADFVAEQNGFKRKTKG